MHIMHEHQVNDRYDPQATRCVIAQLDHALFAALHTNKDTATYWVEESERLAGRIAIAQAGGTIRSAIKLIPAGERHYLQPEDAVEPKGDLYAQKATQEAPQKATQKATQKTAPALLDTALLDGGD